MGGKKHVIFENGCSMCSSCSRAVLRVARSGAGSVHTELPLLVGTLSRGSPLVPRVTFFDGGCSENSFFVVFRSRINFFLNSDDSPKQVYMTKKYRER